VSVKLTSCNRLQVYSLTVCVWFHRILDYGCKPIPQALDPAACTRWRWKFRFRKFRLFFQDL